MAELKKEVIITGEPNSLIKQDWKRWIRNTILFIIPVAILYLTYIASLLNDKDHIFQLRELLPNQMVWGGLVVYILSTLQDLYLKWSQETKYTK